MTDAETKRELNEMRTMIEEIHAAVLGGTVQLDRKPGRLAMKLAARKMLAATTNKRSIKIVRNESCVPLEILKNGMDILNLSDRPHQRR